MSIRTGIVGTGVMGRKHVKALSLCEEYELCGVMDLRPEALKAAHEVGVDPALCHTDIDTFFATSLDCVIISTTAPSHYPLAMRAVEAGVKYLLVEKPFCVSISQAVRLRTDCEAGNIRLAVNHGSRFFADYVWIKDCMAQSGLGEPTSLAFHGGNIGVAMNASHLVESFRFLTGSAATEVSAWLMPNPLPNPRGPQFFDAAGQLRMKNAKGQRFYIEIGPDQGHGMFLLVHFQHGQLQVDLLAGQASLNRRKPEYLEMPNTRYGLPLERKTLSVPKLEDIPATAEVLKALAAGKNYPDGEIGEQVVRALVAAYVSQENGHRAVAVSSSELPMGREFPWA